MPIGDSIPSPSLANREACLGLGGGWGEVDRVRRLSAHDVTRQLPAQADTSADGDSTCPSYITVICHSIFQGLDHDLTCPRRHPCRKGPANVSTQLGENPSSKPEMDPVAKTGIVLVRILLRSSCMTAHAQFRS